MSLFLIKNLSITSFLILLFIFYSQQIQAAKYEYELDFDARYGSHYYGPPTTSTNRHSFKYEQKSEFDKQWSSIIGFQAETESAYASVPERYGSGEVGRYDSQTFLPRDNYLQYQDGIFRTRAGYQQVVWGEAFGYYYADIVNPKDYREAGLGDLSRNRLNTALLNMQWIFSDSALQLIYIPKASNGLMPSSGSDFNAVTLPSAFSQVPLTIKREPQNPLTRGEYGARFSQQISRLDLSLFYFNYYDRLPVYELQVVPFPPSVTVAPDFKPLQTAGLTATLDINSYLLRSEILQHFKHELNTGDGVNISTAQSNELVYVLGLDLPQIDKWQVSFQYSESRLEKKDWLGRQDLQSIASLRVAKTFSRNIEIESLLTNFPQDSSTLAQLQFSAPLSNQTEILLGLDKFDGSEESSLGRFKNASRVWVMFKAKLKK